MLEIYSPFLRTDRAGSHHSELQFYLDPMISADTIQEGRRGLTSPISDRGGFDKRWDDHGYEWCEIRTEDFRHVVPGYKVSVVLIALSAKRHTFYESRYSRIVLVLDVSLRKEQELTQVRDVRHKRLGLRSVTDWDKSEMGRQSRLASLPRATPIKVSAFLHLFS